jgi:hypothetical protein
MNSNMNLNKRLEMRSFTFGKYNGSVYLFQFRHVEGGICFRCIGTGKNYYK